jgi:FixJ family two-component response regulator
MIYCVEDDNNIRDLVIYALKQAAWTQRDFQMPTAFIRLSVQTKSLFGFAGHYASRRRRLFYS